LKNNINIFLKINKDELKIIKIVQIKNKKD